VAIAADAYLTNLRLLSFSCMLRSFYPSLEAWLKNRNIRKVLLPVPAGPNCLETARCNGTSLVNARDRVEDVTVMYFTLPMIGNSTYIRAVIRRVDPL
jgi:hypothetical protein